MRILCRHGHYAFFPRGASDVQQFAAFYNIDLVGERDYFTFRNLVGLPTYSLKGRPYGGVIATKTFSGLPWEVMQANDLVYNLKTGTLVNKNSITTTVKPFLSDWYYFCETVLFQAGSLLTTGEKILNFDAEFNFQDNQLRIRSLRA